MNKARKQLSALRDLLRHLGHPERLRLNDLVAYLFPDGSDSATAAARARSLVERAVDDLPSRQRDIIRRCDLRGEQHSAVISALAICERHFYRERRSALESLNAALTSVSQTPASRKNDALQDSLALTLCFADAALQLGDINGALRALQNAGRDRLDCGRRIQLECRLAEFCCEAGAIDEAKLHIETARRASFESVDANRTSAPRIDAVDATVAWRSGDFENAVHLSQGAVSVLRREVRQGIDKEDAEALALALIVLSEKDLASGRWESARAKTMEAHETIVRSGTDRAALSIRVRSAATEAFVYDLAHLSDASFEYERLFREAIGRGLTLEAMRIAWRLCQFHRFADEPHRTVAALQNILPVARRILTIEERAELCVGLASAYVACGRPSEAHTVIAQVRADALPGGFMSEISQLIAADAYLLENRYAEALKLSAAGVASMQRLGRLQSVGSALRIQADANYAMGNVGSAKHSIDAALRYLDGAAAPYVIAKAHLSAARITGKSFHKRTAEEISARLRPAASNSGRQN